MIARPVSWTIPVAMIAFIAVWQWAAWATGEFTIAGPQAVAIYLHENAGLIARSAWATCQSAAWGFVFGNLLGIAMACLVIIFPRVERMMSGIALIVFCLPLVATGPILRVLFGAGDGPQITLAALAVYFTTYLAMVVGLRAVPQSWTDLMQTYGRNRAASLLYVRANASLPYLIAALQIAGPAAFLGAMVGEFTGAERGLGVLTIRAMRALDVPATWSIALVSSAIAMIIYAACVLLGKATIKGDPPLLLSPPQHVKQEALMVKVAYGAGIACVAISLWHGVMVAFDLSPFFAKRPFDIVTYLFMVDGAGDHRARLFSAFSDTLILTVPGYLFGLLSGAVLASLIVLRPGLGTVFLPVAVLLRSVPIIVTAPLIVLALGRGALGTVTIVAVMIFFPTFIACLQGLRQIPGQIQDVFDSYAAPRWRLLLAARIPAMLPAFFAAARMAVPAAFLAVTTVEWLATGRGVGSLMALTASTSDYNMLWSAIALLAAVASLAYVLIGAVERAILSKYAGEQLAR